MYSKRSYLVNHKDEQTQRRAVMVCKRAKGRPRLFGSGPATFQVSTIRENLTNQSVESFSGGGVGRGLLRQGLTL